MNRHTRSFLDSLVSGDGHKPLALLALVIASASAVATGLVDPISGFLPMFVGMATQIGDITETSTPDEHQPRDVSMTLSKLRPDVFTLDTIMRRMEASSNGMPTEAATQVKVEWEEDDVISYTTEAAGSVSSGSNGNSKTLTVKDGEVPQENDLLYLPDNSNSPGAVLYVSSKSGADLTVYRAEMDTSETSFGAVPGIGADETVKVLSRGKAEQDTASEAQGTMPAQLYNYTQILDQVVSASETRMATDNYTEADYTRNRDSNLYEFRRKLENAQVFGERMKLTDPDTGNQITFMGGITSFLDSNDLIYSNGSLSETTLIDFARQIFSGNNGSRLRWLFSTPKQTAEIDKILLASGTLQSTRDENVLGVEATRLHTSFGDLMLINNQAFAEIGKENYGLVIDPMNVRRRTLRNMTINENVQANDVDGRADQWIEEATIEVRKESTHAVLRDDSTDSFE